MTFPTIPTSGASTLLTSSQATATTTHTFPSLTTLAQSSGDLMIAVIVTYQGGSTNAEFSSWGGGFTEFVDQSANSSTVQSIGAAYKFATGSETGTFTVTTVASTRSAMFLMTIPGAHTSTPPEATAKADGTSAAADPASLNPGGWDAEDTLWVAVAANGETSLTGSFTGITAAPASYTSYLDSGIIGGDVIGAIEGAVAFRQNAAASEDVGAFTLDVGAAGNSALLIAVRPAPAGASPPVHAASSFLAYTGAGVTSAAIPKPSGIVAGSTCVVRFLFECTAASPPTSITPPASGGTWTHVSTNAGDQGDGTGTRQVIYEYRAGASETSTSPASTWTFTWTNGSYATATAHRITGAATSGAIVDATVDHEFAGTASTSAPTTQLTTSGDNRLLLWLAVSYFGSANWTPPSGFTEIQDDANLASAWKTQAAAGDTGALTGSSDLSDRKVAFLGAIGPPAAGGDATATPAVVTATTTVPNGARNVAAGPAVTAATSTTPASSRAIAVGPAAVAATTTVPNGNRNITAGPVVLASVAALPAATAQVGTNTTATPAVATATTTVPDTARNVAAGPGALASVAALPAATAQAVTTATPAATAATTTVPTSTRNTAAGPASVPATVTVPTATAGMGAGPTRQFDSTDDHVICAVGSGGMATLPTGAWTVATLARRSTDGTWDTIASFETSGNSAQAGLQIRDTNLLCGLFASDNNSTGGVATPASDGWCVYAVTKAAGTATPRTHKVVVSTGTPTHTNATSSHGNGASVSGGRLQFGRWQSSDLLGGWLAMVAAWDQVLSDSEVEQLAVGLQEWLDLAPTGLWQFRQASTGTAVTDDIGDADQTSLTGTTVDAAEGPAPFDWEVSGDATATPATITTTTTLPTAARNVAAGPAPVAATVAVPTPTTQTGTGATATPATIAATTTIPASTRHTSAGPAAVAAAVTAPQATAVAGGAAAVLYGSQLGVPTAQLGDFQLGTTPAVSGNVTAAPATIAAVAAVGVAQPVVPSTVVPAVLAAVAALPSSARNVGAGPAVLTATATLARPDLNSSTSPAVLAAAGSLARPNVNVAAGPLVVPLVVAVPQATPVTAGNATVTPAATLMVVAVAQATPLASSAVTPAAISVAVTIPGVGASTGASPAVLAALTALARPSVHVAAGPAVVPVVVGLPAPTILAGGNVTMTPAVVAAVAALARPNVNVVAGPAGLATSIALSRPLIDVAAGPATILSVVVVGLAVPQVGAGGNPTPATITAIAAVVRPNVNVRAGPLAIPTLVALPAALAGQSISRTPTTITVVAGLAAVAVSTSAGPPAIAVLITLPAVADVGGEPNPGGGQVVIGVPGGGLAVAVGHGHGLVVMPTRGTVSAGRTGSEVTVG